MTTEQAIKYLEFLKGECARHLADGKVTNEELRKTLNELPVFKERCAESAELSTGLKEKVANLRFLYSTKDVSRNEWLFAVSILTVGIWSLVLWYVGQKKRTAALYNLEDQLKELIAYATLNG